MDEKHTWDKVNSWQRELELLKSILNKTELIETTKWGAPVYTSNNKNIVGLGGFKNYFAIWFFNGVFLKDEKKLLVNAQEGVTKSLRQWRFSSIEELDEELILEYVHEAIQNEKEGKVIKPVKRELIIPDYFTKMLQNNPELQTAFNKFTPYKQKEFIEYLETAKREETRNSRLEKILPMISEGIGLNDKFRK